MGVAGRCARVVQTAEGEVDCGDATPPSDCDLAPRGRTGVAPRSAGGPVERDLGAARSHTRAQLVPEWGSPFPPPLADPVGLPTELHTELSAPLLQVAERWRPRASCRCLLAIAATG